MKGFASVILAAGEGTRMKSSRPKILYPLLGAPMIAHVIEEVQRAAEGACIVLVVGRGKDEVKRVVTEQFPKLEIRYAVQHNRLGTGHAARIALKELPQNAENVLITMGDMPLVSAATFRSLMETHIRTKATITILTSLLNNPTGYGRIIRSQGGSIIGIKEEADCSAAEKTIKEVNAAVYCFSLRFLRANLAKLKQDNAKGEFYLTDLVQTAASLPFSRLESIEAPPDEARGVNDRKEAAEAERVMLERLTYRLMLDGVTIVMPWTVYLEKSVQVAPESVLEPFVVLRGKCSIGRGCTVGVGSVLIDATVEDGASVGPYCVIEKSVLHQGSQVGPFARLRQGSEIMPGARVGNFVETKKTRLGEGSKANHLAYLGDGIIGKNVNIGAGTIFCNYDGFHKHITCIEDGAFIGSDTQFVAPVTVGRNAYVASGSTITYDVPAEALAVARARQVNKPNFAPLMREKLKKRHL